MGCRIAFVLPTLEGGGAERTSLSLLNNLDRDRFEPVLILFERRGPLVAHLSPDIPVVVLGRPRLRQALPGLFSALRRLNPRVVFSTLGYVNLPLLAGRALLPSRARLIIREANTPSASLPTQPWPRLFAAAYRRLYPRADGVICPSELVYEELARDFRVAESRLHLVHNPVDEDRMRADLLPQRFGGRGTQLVAVGRLTRQKGFDRLLYMLARARTDIQVTILGQGGEEAALRSLAKRLSVGERVHFAGFHPNPWPIMSGADAFVLPSRWEGMPNAALEALACGIPVIATPEAGGIRDVAAMAAPGAVILAEEGDAFIAAMEALIPHSKAELRPSLLPDAFRLPVLQKHFERLLADYCQR